MIFPDFNHLPHAVVDLDVEARQWRAEHSDVAKSGENPLLDPAVCQSMVDDMHCRLSVVWSYGGWMENRSVLWAGSYLEQDKKFNHLGIDFNVPSGTQIMTHRKLEVVRADEDDGEEGGWGPLLIMQPRDGDQSIMLIYGHLSREWRCKVGDILSPGSIFAEVGEAPYNGNWFPHVHVQAITAKHYEHLLKNNLRDLDGYCTDAEKADALVHFPDPIVFL